MSTCFLYLKLQKLIYLYKRIVEDDHTIYCLRPSSRYVYKVDRVVKGPVELDVLGIGHHVAEDVHHFALSDPVDNRLGIFAYWNICNGRIRVARE